MKRCPSCNHAWENRKPNPEQCPKCKAYLDTPTAPPTALRIPLTLIRDYKRTNAIALSKFEGQGERSHAHGVVLGRIQALEWLEAEIEKGRKRL